MTPPEGKQSIRGPTFQQAHQPSNSPPSTPDCGGMYVIMKKICYWQVKSLVEALLGAEGCRGQDRQSWRTDPSELGNSHIKLFADRRELDQETFPSLGLILPPTSGRKPQSILLEGVRQAVALGAPPVPFPPETVPTSPNSGLLLNRGSSVGTRACPAPLSGSPRGKRAGLSRVERTGVH